MLSPVRRVKFRPLDFKQADRANIRLVKNGRATHFHQVALVGLDLQDVPERDDLEPFFFKPRDLLRQNIQRILLVMSNGDCGTLFSGDPTKLDELALNRRNRAIVIEKKAAL